MRAPGPGPVLEGLSIELALDILLGGEAGREIGKHPGDQILRCFDASSVACMASLRFSSEACSSATTMGASAAIPSAWIRQPAVSTAELACITKPDISSWSFMTVSRSWWARARAGSVRAAPNRVSAVDSLRSSKSESVLPGHAALGRQAFGAQAVEAGFQCQDALGRRPLVVGGVDEVGVKAVDRVLQLEGTHAQLVAEGRCLAQATAGGLVVTEQALRNAAAGRDGVHGG